MDTIWPSFPFKNACSRHCLIEYAPAHRFRIDHLRTSPGISPRSCADDSCPGIRSATLVRVRRSAAFRSIQFSAHKARRGFRATANWSLHRFYDPNLARIMAEHIEEINRMEQERIDMLNQAVPFAEGRSGRP